jgi:O-succinylbenzoic acid--CoA ligase
VVYDRRPLDGVELRIVAGEVHVRGPMLLRCYRDGTDPKTSDGWFPTGDLGDIDDDGLLHVHGRRGDLIITGGENVWPDPVEALLRRYPGVADVGIAGVADREWGHVVTAFVVPTDPAAPPALDELRDAVKAELPAFHAPRRLVLVDTLPRTALGKLRRSDLASRA